MSARLALLALGLLVCAPAALADISACIVRTSLNRSSPDHVRRLLLPLLLWGDVGAEGARGVDGWRRWKWSATVSFFTLCH